MSAQLDPALHSHFGVFISGGRCIHILHDYDVAQRVAMLEVFKKRSGYKPGLVWPLLQISRGHYRINFDTLIENNLQ